jgi:tetratricopeptide (TPR) repeat protein
VVSHGPETPDRPSRSAYLALLQIPADADPAVIRAAITAQRRRWRRRTTAPDINARQEAERRMQALDDAERVLFGPGAHSDEAPPSSYEPPAPQSPEPAPSPSPGQRGSEGNPWLVKAAEQLGRGDADVAVFTARRAVEEDPRNAFAWAILARAAARTDDHETAVSAIDRALALEPESAPLHGDRGWILDRSGRSERAVAAYRTAARLAPDRIDYRVRSVLALLRSGRTDEAVKEGEDAYRARPDDGDVRTALGTALAERAVHAQHELPDGSLIIDSEQQANYVLALANRGLSVRPTDPEVVSDLERQRDYARRATSRRLSPAAVRRNWRWPLGLGLLVLAGGCCSPTIYEAGRRGDPFQLAFAVGLTIVVLTFLGAVLYTCFEPVYRRNAALMARTVPMRVGRGPGRGPGGGFPTRGGRRHGDKGSGGFAGGAGFATEPGANGRLARRLGFQRGRRRRRAGAGRNTGGQS